MCSNEDYLKALQYMSVLAQTNFDYLETVGLATYNRASLKINLYSSATHMHTCTHVTTM
jgi:hypothetical protein